MYQLGPRDVVVERGFQGHIQTSYQILKDNHSIYSTAFARFIEPWDPNFYAPSSHWIHPIGPGPDPLTPG